MQAGNTHIANGQGRVQVGLYGANGHQVQSQLIDHVDGQLKAVAAIAEDQLPQSVQEDAGVGRFDSLDAMIAAGGLDLVVLCSPIRAHQADDAIRCLNAGISVLAEKPCALIEADIDRVLEAARASGCEFWEMAGLPLEAPFRRMRECVLDGSIGEVVQVLVQKSYPWTTWRPTDESIDGGLACQVGLYGARFAEHVANLEIADVRLRESTVGNGSSESACRRAVELSMEFSNGAIGTAICNYCNPIGDLSWGYDCYRIFGTQGILEFDQASQLLSLLKDGQRINLSIPDENDSLLDCLLRHLRNGDAMPIDVEPALKPTRWVLRAKRF